MSILKIIHEQNQETRIKTSSIHNKQNRFSQNSRVSSNSTSREVVVTPGWYRINKKFLSIAVVLLAIALVFPTIIIFYEQSVNLTYINNYRPDLNDQTAFADYTNQLQGTQNAFLLILVLFEIIVGILFALSLWVAIKQPVEKHLEHEHPEHD